MVRGSMVAFIRVWLSVVVLGGLIVLAPRAGAQATPEPAVRWERYDVTLDVGPDGAIGVTEAQVVAFHGTFRRGFATIPLRVGEAIEDVRVSVGVGADSTPVPSRLVPPDRYRDDAGTFTFAERAGAVEIDYAFEPTRLGAAAKDNARVIVLEYTMRGAIRQGASSAEPRQEIWWTAISTDVTDIAEVAQASVTIILPMRVAAGETSADPAWDEADGQAFTWRASGLDAGDALEVRLRFPAITGAATPAARSDPAWMPGFRASEMRY